MTVLLFAIFGALALAAVAFAAAPLLRAGRGRAGWILAAALACAVFGIGIGVYLMLGSPQIALRSLAGPENNDLRGWVAVAAAKARNHPRDEATWEVLGAAYMKIEDGQDAAGAYRRALLLAPASRQVELLDDIGASLTGAASGQVTAEAEEAFGEALRRDPHDVPARFYLGFAYAGRRDNARAIAVWRNLLSDIPPKAPLYGALVDHIARLTVEGGGAAPPDIGAMVAGLAARLEAQPNDPEGWQRLVRSYVVLGDRTKAQAALKDARTAMKTNAPATAALNAEAKELGLP